MLQSCTLIKKQGLAGYWSDKDDWGVTERNNAEWCRLTSRLGRVLATKKYVYS